MIGEPLITVTCDLCEVGEEFGLTALAGGGWDARNLSGKMKRSGWAEDGKGGTLCADCAADEEDASHGQ